MIRWLEQLVALAVENNKKVKDKEPFKTVGCKEVVVGRLEPFEQQLWDTARFCATQCDIIQQKHHRWHGSGEHDHTGEKCRLAQEELDMFTNRSSVVRTLFWHTVRERLNLHSVEGVALRDGGLVVKVPQEQKPSSGLGELIAL